MERQRSLEDRSSSAAFKLFRRSREPSRSSMSSCRMMEQQLENRDSFATQRSSRKPSEYIKERFLWKANKATTNYAFLTSYAASLLASDSRVPCWVDGRVCTLIISSLKSDVELPPPPPPPACRSSSLLSIYRRVTKRNVRSLVQGYEQQLDFYFHPYQRLFLD